MSMLNVLSCKSAFVIELFYWLVMIIAFDHRLLLLRCHPSHWPGRMQVLMTPDHIPWNLRLRPVQCHILLWDSFVIAAFVNRVMITMSLSRYLTIWSNTKHAHASQYIYTCIHTVHTTYRILSGDGLLQCFFSWNIWDECIHIWAENINEQHRKQIQR